MNPEKIFAISALWDDEAGVWVAQSDDVPGLITEASTMDQLVAKLKVMIPEMLDENGYVDGEEVNFTLKSELTVRTYRHAA